MKTKIVLAWVIIVLLAAVNKTYAIGSVAPSYNDVINTYIDSYITGNFKKMDNVLENDANVKMSRAGLVLLHNKNNLLQQMKNEANTHQNCESKYKIIETNDAMVIAQVDFKYDDFVQHNYLILEKNKNKQWKITQVCRFFEDTTTGNSPATYATTKN